MEKILKSLFEFQRFEQNTRLSRLIAQTEDQHFRALDDDALWQVNAAGTPEEFLNTGKNQYQED